MSLTRNKRKEPGRKPFVPPICFFSPVSVSVVEKGKWLIVDCLMVLVSKLKTAKVSPAPGHQKVVHETSAKPYRLATVTRTSATRTLAGGLEGRPSWATGPPSRGHWAPDRDRDPPTSPDTGSAEGHGPERDQRRGGDVKDRRQSGAVVGSPHTQRNAIRAPVDRVYVIR